MGVKKKGKYDFETLGWVLGEYRRCPSYLNLKPTSKAIYEKAFDRLHKFGNQPMSGLRRAHILRIMDDLSSTPGLANTVITAFRVLCKFALDREYIEVDPSVRIPQMKVNEWRRWTDAELLRFYDETYDTAAPKH